MSRILVAGASGHARVVADVVRSQATGDEVCGFITPDLETGATVGGAPVLGDDDAIADIVRSHDVDGWICGMGVNEVRRRVTERLGGLAPGLANIRAVDASSSVGSDVQIGAGTVLMPGSIVNAGTRIGAGCVINTGASVDHDGQIADFVSISPGVTLGGGCRIGVGSFIGLGATVIHDIAIGSHTVVGAGSLVNRDLPDNVVAYGTPARIIRHRQPSDPYL